MRIKSTHFQTPIGNVYDFKQVYKIMNLQYTDRTCYFEIKNINKEDIYLEYKYSDYALSKEEIIKFVKEYRMELIKAWTNSNIFKPKTNLNEYKRKK